MRHLGHFWLEFSSTKNKKATESLRIFAFFCEKNPCGRPNFFHRSSNGCFRKWWYPQIIQFNRDFHYKSSILGTPIFGNTQMVRSYSGNVWLHTEKSSGSRWTALRRGFLHFWWSIYTSIFVQHWIIYVYIHTYIYIYMYICRTFPPKKGGSEGTGLVTKSCGTKRCRFAKIRFRRRLKAPENSWSFEALKAMAMIATRKLSCSYRDDLPLK